MSFKYVLFLSFCNILKITSLGKLFIYSKQVNNAKPTYFPLPTPDFFLSTIDSFGPHVSSVVRPTFVKGAEDMSRAKYAIDVAVSNMMDTFENKLSFDEENQLVDVQIAVGNISHQPFNTLMQTVTFMFNKATTAQAAKGKIDEQLATILNAGIRDAAKCMTDLGDTASLELIKATGSVSLAFQHVRRNRITFIGTLVALQ